MSSKKFVNRRILVVGGGSGIGRAAALRCVNEGADVTIVGRRKERLTDVAAESNCHIFPADMRDPHEVHAAVRHAAEAMNGIDGVVNAAGVLDTTPAEAIDDELWNGVLAANLTATFLVCRETLPYLRRRPGASIVNVAALAAIIPGVASVAYAAAKAGVIQLSHSLAAQISPAVRVNSVCPGAVDTDMTQGFLHDKGDEGRNAFVARYACKRLAAPDEIASLICFLLSDEASYITGSNFVADGGRAYR